MTKQSKKNQSPKHEETEREEDEEDLEKDEGHDDADNLLQHPLMSCMHTHPRQVRLLLHRVLAVCRDLREEVLQV